MESFSEKTAVVTGAGSGIGRETALLLARRGARLAICDVNAGGLEETAVAARAAGAEVMTQEVDVSGPENVEAFAGAVNAEYGPADLVVNNAGIGVMGSFLETELSDWDRLVGINLMGVVHGCRSFLPAMIESGRGGHIANVASQAGFQANPALTAYSATKFGVLGFSEALRSEMRPHGIGVTAICPGVVNTAIVRDATVRGERTTERQAKVVRLYERRSYGPEKVAVHILRAVERNRAVAPITPEAKLGYFLSRVAPPLSRWTSAKLAGLTQ